MIMSVGICARYCDEESRNGKKSGSSIPGVNGGRNPRKPGGSWGADGFLYLSGHDPAEIYKMRLPRAGSALELVDTIAMNIRGQGIAWDRSQAGVIYGIIRATAKEKAAGGEHKVTVFKLGEAP